MFAKNCCDGAYKSYDVHFTNICDNKCAFCVDKGSVTVNKGRPNWRAIANSIITNSAGFDDVLILGGEPCLFLKDLENLVLSLKLHTALKVYVTSSMPHMCYAYRGTFAHILEMVDGFNISAQHHDERIADQIRGTTSTYDRQAFYASLPYKNKIRINLNVVRGLLDTPSVIKACIQHYAGLGVSSIKLSEIQHSTNDFISFEKIFDVTFPSPYSGGCQQWLDAKAFFDVDTPVLLKRSCFMCEDTLKASITDGVKVLSKILTRQPMIDNRHYGVVYEDGTIANGWLKN